MGFNKILNKDKDLKNIDSTRKLNNLNNVLTNFKNYETNYEKKILDISSLNEINNNKKKKEDFKIIANTNFKLNFSIFQKMNKINVFEEKVFNYEKNQSKNSRSKKVEIISQFFKLCENERKSRKSENYKSLESTDYFQKSRFSSPNM